LRLSKSAGGRKMNKTVMLVSSDEQPQLLVKLEKEINEDVLVTRRGSRIYTLSE
jgi:hypothetical protein